MFVPALLTREYGNIAIIHVFDKTPTPKACQKRYVRYAKVCRKMRAKEAMPSSLAKNRFLSVASEFLGFLGTLALPNESKR
jgi:hypothetical protein